MSSKTLWPARARRARVANSSPRTPCCSRCRGSTGRVQRSRATTSNPCSRGSPRGRWACPRQRPDRLTVESLPLRSSSFASACITSASIASGRTQPDTALPALARLGMRAANCAPHALHDGRFRNDQPSRDAAADSECVDTGAALAARSQGRRPPRWTTCRVCLGCAAAASMKSATTCHPARSCASLLPT
jgi:hypothetical protein